MYKYLWKLIKRIKVVGLNVAIIKTQKFAINVPMDVCNSFTKKQLNRSG